MKTHKIQWIQKYLFAKVQPGAPLRTAHLPRNLRRGEQECTWNAPRRTLGTLNRKSWLSKGLVLLYLYAFLYCQYTILVINQVYVLNITNCNYWLHVGSQRQLVSEAEALVIGNAFSTRYSKLQIQGSAAIATSVSEKFGFLWKKGTYGYLMVPQNPMVYHGLSYVFPFH